MASASMLYTIQRQLDEIILLLKSIDAKMEKSKYKA